MMNEQQNPRNEKEVTMKKALILTCALILAGGLALTAWTAPDHEDETFDEVVVQELRELEMKGKMLQQLGWDATSIEIEIDDGTVTLSGEVSEPVTKKMAKQIAKSFEATTKVHNRIEVQDDSAEETETPVADAVATAEEKVQDAVLETRVKTKLLSELGRHGFDVEVEAADGVVSLRGELPDEQRREVALETVRNFEGVDEVINLLKIKGS